MNSPYVPEIRLLLFVNVQAYGNQHSSFCSFLIFDSSQREIFDVNFSKYWKKLNVKNFWRSLSLGKNQKKSKQFFYQETLLFDALSEIDNFQTHVYKRIQSELQGCWNKVGPGGPWWFDNFLRKG